MDFENNVWHNSGLILDRPINNVSDIFISQKITTYLKSQSYLTTDEQVKQVLNLFSKKFQLFWTKH